MKWVGLLRLGTLWLEGFLKKNHVLRYDMRGAGMSEKVRGSLSIEVMADDLAELLNALGLLNR